MLFPTPLSDSYSLEPLVKTFLNDLVAQGGPPVYDLSITEARQALIGLQAGEVEKPAAHVEERLIKQNGKTISIRIIKPARSQYLLPVLMYFHGGGWILGNAFTHDRLVRELANGMDAAVVFVNYTPSPESHYPVALEEAYVATKYISRNGSRFGLDGSNLAVAGDGAGGNMAAAITILAKERKGPAIIFQLLFYPVTDARLDNAADGRVAVESFLTQKTIQWFWNAYAPDRAVHHFPTVSPLKASQESLQGLPEALIITAEYDLFRDEGEAYARKLSEAGVPITATRYLGIVHDFVMLNALTHTKATRAAIKQATGMLKEAFGKAAKPL